MRSHFAFIFFDNPLHPSFLPQIQDPIELSAFHSSSLSHSLSPAKRKKKEELSFNFPNSSQILPNPSGIQQGERRKREWKSGKFKRETQAQKEEDEEEAVLWSSPLRIAEKPSEVRERKREEEEGSRKKTKNKLQFGKL